MNQKPRKPSLKAINETSELDKKREELKDKEQEFLKSIKVVSSMRAKTLKAIFDSYVEAGFDSSQALELIKKSMEVEAFIAKQNSNPNKSRSFKR